MLHLSPSLHFHDQHGDERDLRSARLHGIAVQLGHANSLDVLVDRVHDLLLDLVRKLLILDNTHADAKPV